MHLIRQDLLRRLERLLHHKIRERSLLEVRRAGDNILLQRPHSQLNFGITQRSIRFPHTRILTSKLDNVHTLLRSRPSAFYLNKHLSDEYNHSAAGRTYGSFRAPPIYNET